VSDFRAVLLDGLGTLLRLHPPAPLLRRELAGRFGLRFSLAEAEAALAAEILFYRAHMLEGRDRAALAILRRRAAGALRAELPPAGRDLPLGPLTEALMASLRFSPFPDVPPALRALRRRGLRLVAVSNWDVSLHDRLAEAGLRPLLHGALTSAELGVAKPNPALFRHALTLAGVPAAAAIHVGDTPSEDVVGARAAGVRAVLLRRGGVAAQTDAPTIATLHDLPALVHGRLPSSVQ
jgi:putative hydrolase of the HAD superfamily